MKIAVVFRLIHVVLSPLLIFGIWIFPRLGVNGAAVTNVISQSAGTAMAFWILMSGRSRLRLSFKGFKLDPPIIWRIVRVGLPASVMGMERNLAQFILVKFMAPFGTLAMAAHTLNQRIEMILFMPAWGLGMAAGVLTGQNLGAGRPDRAEKSGWLAAGLVEIFVVVCAAGLFLWAEVAVRAFTSDPALVETASSFLRIAAVGYLFMGLAAVFQQSISGAGDTVLPMIMSFLTAWVIQMPLAYLLPKVTDLGVFGVRWAVVIPMIVGSIAYAAYFRAGRWKRKKV